MKNNAPHTTVLLAEATAALALNPGDIAVDCTVGFGGHTERMLAAVGKSGKVIGLDRDASALALARSRLAPAIASGNLELVQTDFASLSAVLTRLGVSGNVAGVLADIGVSSMQIDTAERGFSFMSDGPLDMRMDQSRGQTAAELLATASTEELTQLFRDLGEDPKSKQIARRIVKDRGNTPITTTAQLAALVKDAAAYRTPSKKHPATRVFQALRIAVNDELGQLESLLESAFSTLRPGGHLAIIAFHSLEDRIVKNAFIGLTGRRERANIDRNLPIRDADVQAMHRAKANIIKPFPLTPSETEIQANPRSRSAKLRVVTKL